MYTKSGAKIQKRFQLHKFFIQNLTKKLKFCVRFIKINTDSPGIATHKDNEIELTLRKWYIIYFGLFGTMNDVKFCAQITFS